MITTNKVTEIFCMIDDFSKNLDKELRKNLSVKSQPTSAILQIKFEELPCWCRKIKFFPRPAIDFGLYL